MRRGVAAAVGLLLMPFLAAAHEVEYYHLDALGSVRAVTDGSGAVLVRHDYEPYGEEWEGEPSADTRRFTGKERDSESGLDYFGARYYSAPVGRFTSVDPVYTWSENLADPERWNRYAYARNNPLRYIDPDGSHPIVIPIAMAVAFVLNNVTNTNVTEGPINDTIIPNSVIVAGGAGFAVGGARMAAKEVFQEGVENLTGLPVGGLPSVATGVRANRAAGDAWSQAVGAELKATHEVAVSEITVRTRSGARTRLDWVTKDREGVIGCVECKASAKARLTRGQKAAHPEIAETGGVVVGKGKPGIPGGTVIPPKAVEVRRPQ